MSTENIILNESKDAVLHRLNQANTYKEMGDAQRATEEYRLVLEMNPAQPEALHWLGIKAAEAGHYEEAIKLVSMAIQSAPETPLFYNDLGVILGRLGRMSEAMESYRHALALNPFLIEALCNLGAQLIEFGRLEEALGYLDSALAIQPENIVALVNLGATFRAMSKFTEAVNTYIKVIELAPDIPEAYNNLGDVFKELGYLDEAVECFEKAISIKPGYVEANANLGNAFKEQQKLDKAFSWLGKTLELAPNLVAVHTNLVNTTLYSPDYDGAAIFQEHRKWAEIHAQTLYPSKPMYSNDRDSERHIKIGYVSYDFRGHATAFFIEPVLESHNQSEFEIICYDNCAVNDPIKNRLMKLPNGWRDISNLTDDQVVKLVRDDGIDILVDLMGQTRGHRLQVFAKKPAPVQVTWLGYPNSTGLQTIDYWITDKFIANPDGMTDQFCTETLVALPDFYMCFKPTPDSPEVTPLPALERGYVTFGSFNAFLKVTPKVIELWSRVLTALPNSRLIMMTVPGGTTQQSVYDQFARLGVAPDRVEIAPRVSHHDFLRLHQVVDIALDPFPYNGTTTTLHGFWMGLPVITLAGRTFASRVGLSLLSNIGLPHLIATSPERYVEIAVELATDFQALSRLRMGLRERMASSPLVDASRFTQNLENAYRKMWRDWCSTSTKQQLDA